MNYEMSIFSVFILQVSKGKVINLSLTVDLVITGTKVSSHSGLSYIWICTFTLV